MKKKIKRVLWITGLLLLSVIAVPFAAGAFLYARADFRVPAVQIDLDDYPFTTANDSVRVIGRSHLIRNGYGIWEAFVEGSAVERGAVLGKMSEDLLYGQEKVFVDQINEMVPSKSYVRFLCSLIKIFNGRMASLIPEEYLEEIYAMSLSCSHEYDMFGTPYERQLNYHAAHDIGHAMQQYMLVGCSSFAVWDGCSRDSSLYVGRNFDFYVGDDFARNRMVVFVSPDKGYKYASVTWPGMIGVLSGMNEKGLTVTINAAKGRIPTSSAMPISILARTILQYAEDIESAFRIAGEHRIFVSESLLIGSAKDDCAAIIEKTPERTVLYRAPGDRIICTNHYQSEAFSTDRYNLANLRDTDSKYRYERLRELIREREPLDACGVAEILRDYKGLGDSDIGLTNEKSINQFISNHSVIFQPDGLRMWVSTSPWQMGDLICYDLNEVFSTAAEHRPRYRKEDTIGADRDFIDRIYPAVVEYRRCHKAFRKKIASGERISPEEMDRFLSLNPGFYETYNLAGDYYRMSGDAGRACICWKEALSKEIPYRSDREDIVKKIGRYD